MSTIVYTIWVNQQQRKLAKAGFYPIKIVYISRGCTGKSWKNPSTYCEFSTTRMSTSRLVYESSNQLTWEREMALNVKWSEVVLYVSCSLPNSCRHFTSFICDSLHLLYNKSLNKRQYANRRRQVYQEVISPICHSVVGAIISENVCICRRWKGGTIEPHPTDKALIVNYQLEAAVFGEPENPMLEEKKVFIVEKLGMGQLLGIILSIFRQLFSCESSVVNDF